VADGPEVVVYEAGPRLRQCEAAAVTLPQSAAKLAQAGIPVRTSSCGVRTGIAFPAVCGAGTGEILLHNIATARLAAAEAAGFHAAATLVNGTAGWQRMHCGGYQAFLDLARQSSCAQTRNRVLTINHNEQLDAELILIDQLGTCSDAAYRQLLLGETVNDVLCSNEQTIAGPVKRCPATRYASLFDIIIANLDKADLGLGPGYQVWERM
jgi:hypothetical protein